MKNSLLFNGYFSVALTATVICCLFTVVLFTFRLKSRKHRKSDSRSSGCFCYCKANVIGKTETYLTDGEDCSSGGSGGKEMIERGPMAVASTERLSGASMMEQLVPEITTHALSYLDYPSLCRLSMTNSLMRKAANDDNAWKALYHKDFTLEQDNVTPVNGWKAYYASTRAIVNINAEFFEIIKEKSLPAMGHFWLKADYVKCFLANGESCTGSQSMQFWMRFSLWVIRKQSLCALVQRDFAALGYSAVMESWQLAFSWDESTDFQIRDVRARVLSDSAWVTMKAYLQQDARPFHVTNMFEFHKGRWYMVHHHCSIVLLHGGGPGQQQIVQG